MATNETALILERDGPVAIILMAFLEKRKPDFSTDPDKAAPGGLN
jgi:hypothetical protein